MSESRKPLKVGLFSKLKQRELTGKNQAIESQFQCYVAVYSDRGLSKIKSEKDFKDEITGRKDGDEFSNRERIHMQYLRAYPDFESAEMEAIRGMQYIFDRREKKEDRPIFDNFGQHIMHNKGEKILKKSFLEDKDKKTVSKENLRAGAYYIYKMDGTASEVNEILNMHDKETMEPLPSIGFGERILGAVDNSGKHSFKRSDFTLSESDDFKNR